MPPRLLFTICFAGIKSTLCKTAVARLTTRHNQATGRTEASNSCFVRPCARPFRPICSIDMRVQHMSHGNNAHPNGSAHDAASLNARSARRSDGPCSRGCLRPASQHCVTGQPAGRMQYAVQHACRSLHCARSRSTMTLPREHRRSEFFAAGDAGIANFTVRRGQPEGPSPKISLPES